MLAQLLTHPFILFLQDTCPFYLIVSTIRLRAYEAKYLAFLSFVATKSEYPSIMPKESSRLRKLVFQSSPDSPAECNYFDAVRYPFPLKFQSSPDSPAGCNSAVTDMMRISIGFNPHPTHQPGATCTLYGTCRATCVSILTRLTSRVQRPPDSIQYIASTSFCVSILTRLTSRVQRVARLSASTTVKCFNPHPTHQPGATMNPRPKKPSLDVSILTRLTSRVQQCSISSGIK